MVKLSNCAADLDKEDNGVWVPWIQNGKKTDGELKICRYRTPEFAAANRRVINKMTDATPDEIREAMTPLIAKYILKDWRGFTDENGKAIKYTPEIGAEVLSKREYRDMLDFISEQSLLAENYENDHFQEHEKN